MNYYSELAAALRDRRCNEQQVRDVLESVRGAVALSGDTPERQFGPAEQYATNYRGTRRFSTKHILQAIGPALAAIIIVALRGTLFPDTGFFPWGIAVAAVILIAISAATAALTTRINRALPAGFAAAAE